MKKEILGRIFVMGSDGKEITALIKSSDDELDLSWSAWGPQIAFMSRRYPPGDIYTVRPNGTRLRRITRTGVEEYRPDWQRHIPCTVKGSAAGEGLNVTSGPDVICGGAGRDVFWASAVATLRGRTGSDVLKGVKETTDCTVVPQGDLLRGGPGADRARGRSGTRRHPRRSRS